MILMTGQGDHETDLAAMKAGAADYLSKDHVDARTLERAIRYAIERARTQESLRASEERFRDAFQGAMIGMALIALDGRFLQVNRALCNMVGYSEEELLAKTAQELTQAGGNAGLPALQEKLLHGAPSTQLEKRYLHRQGAIVWVLLSNSLFRDRRGQPLHFISQVQDITPRKQTEKALRQSEEQLRQAQKMEAIGRWLGVWPTTFNNILTVISGYATILAQKLGRQPALRHETEEIQDHRPRRGADAATAGVQPQTIAQPEVLDLNAVVGGMEKMLRRLIGEDIELRR